MLVSDSFKNFTYLTHIDVPILLFVTSHGTNNGSKNLHPASWTIPGFLQYGKKKPASLNLLVFIIGVTTIVAPPGTLGDGRFHCPISEPEEAGAAKYPE
jgi:hypothetical protein